VQKMILHIVKKIRKQYNKDVPIIRIDSVFLIKKFLIYVRSFVSDIFAVEKITNILFDVGENSTIWNTFNSDRKQDIWEYRVPEGSSSTPKKRAIFGR